MAKANKIVTYRVDELRSDDILRRLPESLFDQNISYEWTYDSDTGIGALNLHRKGAVYIYRFADIPISIVGNNNQRNQAKSLLERCLKIKLTAT